MKCVYTHIQLVDMYPNGDCKFFVLQLNNGLVTGVSETMVLNMSTLTWSVVVSVEGKSSVASEVSLLSS